MTQHIEGDRLYILWDDEVAAAQKRHGPRTQRKCDGCARRGAVLDVAVEIEGRRDGRTSRQNQIDDVVAYFVVDVQGIDDMTGLHDLLGTYHGPGNEHGFRR